MLQVTDGYFVATVTRTLLAIGELLSIQPLLSDFGNLAE